VSRASLAFVFGLASAAFVVGTNVAPLSYRLAATPVLLLACGLVSAAGLALAATAGGLLQLAVGYGVLFGMGCGAGYILVQQAVTLAITRRHGLANGYLVSLYPAGAMIAAPLLGWTAGAYGVRVALGSLAAALLLGGLLSAWLIAGSGVALGSGA